MSLPKIVVANIKIAIVNLLWHMSLGKWASHKIQITKCQRQNLNLSIFQLTFHIGDCGTSFPCIRFTQI